MSNCSWIILYRNQRTYLERSTYHHQALIIIRLKSIKNTPQTETEHKKVLQYTLSTWHCKIHKKTSKDGFTSICDSLLQFPPTIHMLKTFFSKVYISRRIEFEHFSFTNARLVNKAAFHILFLLILCKRYFAKSSYENICMMRTIACEDFSYAAGKQNAYVLVGIWTIPALNIKLLQVS